MVRFPLKPEKINLESDILIVLFGVVELTVITFVALASVSVPLLLNEFTTIDAGSMLAVAVAVISALPK